MQNTTMVKEIIDDIEFELMQGIAASDDASHGVSVLRQYQNRLRGEVFASSAALNRDVLARLLRFNDMLITLLQEMNVALQSLRRDLRQVAQAKGKMPPPDVPYEISAPLVFPAGSRERKTSEIENVIRDDVLHLDLHARLTQLPIIGRLIGPLQIFLHRPALFYAHLLADRQAPINRIFGNWILDLDEREAQDNVQIAHLNARVAALESRLDEITKKIDRAECVIGNESRH